MSRSSFVGPLVVVLAVGLLSACTIPGMHGDAHHGEPVVLEAVVATTVAAERAQLPRYEDVLGTVAPRTSALVAPRVSGLVAEYPLEVGDPVSTGALVARLDAPELRRRLEQAQAVAAVAQTELARVERLHANRSISEQDYEAALARARQTAAAQAEAETMVGFMTVNAPITGRVNRTFGDVGDLAMPGQPLLEIVDTTRLEFVATVPVSLAATIREQVAAGEQPTFRVTIDGLDEPLTVPLIEWSPTADPASRTVSMRLDLTAVATNPRVQVGGYGRAAIPLGSQAVVVIPESAIVRRGQMRMVYVAEDDHAVMRLVRLGRPLPDGRRVIQSGLRAGDAVIVSDPDRLRDGQPLSGGAQNGAH